MRTVVTASAAITIAAILALSYLLHASSASARQLAAISRAKSHGAFQLLDISMQERGLTQKMIESNDPDVIESLIDKLDAGRKQAKTKLQQVTGNDPAMVSSFEALVQADDQVKDLLLHAHNAESRQAVVEKSNPAFEAFLGNIQKYQELTAENLDKAAAAADFRINLIQIAIYLLVVGAVTYLVFFGLKFVQSVANALVTVVERIRDVAEGDADLTKRLQVNTNDELGELAKWFNLFMERLQKVVAQVAGSTQRLASASEQISATTQEQAQGAANQTEQAVHLSRSMHDVSATVAQISASSGTAEAAARRASDTARRGGKVVDQTLAQMRGISASVAETAKKVEELGKRSDQVGKITGVIESIAHQTNLLALNAAIEAARAGELGRGFAVVADEVRKLAKRTAEATHEITTVVRGIQDETKSAVAAMESGTKQVQAGVEATTLAGDSLRQIIQSAEEVVSMVTQIAAAASEQSVASEKANQNLGQISCITSETAHGAQETAKACSDVSDLAQELQGVVGQFKLTADEKSERPSIAPPVVPGETANADQLETKPRVWQTATPTSNQPQNFAV